MVFPDGGGQFMIVRESASGPDKYHVSIIRARPAWVPSGEKSSHTSGKSFWGSGGRGNPEPRSAFASWLSLFPQNEDTISHKANDISKTFILMVPTEGVEPTHSREY